MCIQSNQLHNDLKSIIEINQSLKESISKIEKKKETPSAETVFKIFSDAINLQQKLNVFLNVQFENTILNSVQNTIQYMFEHVDYARLSEKQKKDLENKDKYIRFADTPTHIYSDTYPCRFQFGGKYYQNATACHLAQQYIDQPKIMEQFTNCQTADEALDLAQDYPMTFEGQQCCEDVNQKYTNIAMDVLRAKFEQNPDLKNQLLLTGNTYIVCHGNDPFSNDGFDGTGQNILGKLLMQLRKEFGGIAEVLPNITYQIMTEELKKSRPFSLVIELVHSIFLELDALSLLTCACVSKSWNKAVTLLFPLITKEDLEKICKPTLTILESNVREEPPIKAFEVLKWVVRVAPQVENNQGLTLLTIEKGLTLSQLAKEALDIGMSIEISWMEGLSDIPAKNTHRVPLSNNIILETRDKDILEQLAILKKINCLMPELLDFAALCVRTLKKRNVCLFPQSPLRIEGSTYGSSSTQIDESYLMIGGSIPVSLRICQRGFNAINIGSCSRGKF